MEGEWPGTVRFRKARFSVIEGVFRTLGPREGEFEGEGVACAAAGGLGFTGRASKINKKQQKME